MDDEEIPLWDWRRTERLELALSRADQERAQERQGVLIELANARGQISRLEADLVVARSRVQTLETDLEAQKRRLDRLENPPAPTNLPAEVPGNARI